MMRRLGCGTRIYPDSQPPSNSLAAHCRADLAFGVEIEGKDALLDGLGDCEAHDGNRDDAEGNEPALFQFILG